MIRVLLVDDSPLILKELTERFAWEDHGFEVIGTAHNGRDGIIKVESLLPDLVFVDIRMPKMDGLSMIEALQSLEKDIHYIIISAYDDFDYALQALKLNVYNYLLKPIDYDELSHTLLQLREKRPLKHHDDLYKGLDESLKLYRMRATDNKYLRRSLQYIDDHYHEHLTVFCLADNTGISESYLIRLFKDHLNINFKDYLTKLRIFYAMRLLKQTNLPVYVIAKYVGYEDPKYFSTIFKKEMGKTPTEYRSYQNA